LGFVAEGFVFSYLGLTFFSYRFLPFSVSFISAMFCIVIIGRGLATIGLISLLKLCRYERSHPNPLNYRELIFIWCAGLIRGAIAFGLVLRIDSSFAARDLIVTTCLSLVLITTILFGSTVGLVGDCLFKKANEDVAGSGEEIEVSNVDDDASQAAVSSDSSEYSEVQHPNKAPLPMSVYSNSRLASTANDHYQRAESIATPE
jgi:NhaP-type Na+/H+ or K+/H+ antiporter